MKLSEPLERRGRRLDIDLVCNVIGATANRLKLGTEPDSENGPWKRLDSWVRNKLVLMDLGYYSFSKKPAVGASDSRPLDM